MKPPTFSVEHPVAPEEIMAMLDEELSAAERQAVLDHLAQCAECAAVRDRLESASGAIAEWRIPPAPATLDRSVQEAAAAIARNPGRSHRRIRPFVWAGGGALAAVLAVAAGVSVLPNLVLHKMAAHEPPQQGLAINRLEPSASILASLSGLDERVRQSASTDKAGNAAREYRYSGSAGDLTDAPVDKQTSALSTLVAPHSLASELDRTFVAGGGAPTAAVAPTQAAAPMIARTVSLTVLVKNIPNARTALDALLARHSGYAASLTINTPQDGARSFQASLRIPAPQLEAALASLRTFGQVETESQNGEEVTQQHEDLAARLRNARETEDRLRAILSQRAGKMSDVLDVEEQISETRGTIEQMEAEQQALEHRVDYASVDLQLTEQYEARLTGQPTSVGMRLRNSLVAGIRNAGSSVLALALFLEETGPAILVWAVLFFIPAWIAWRRYRRFRSLS